VLRRASVTSGQSSREGQNADLVWNHGDGQIGSEVGPGHDSLDEEQEQEQEQVEARQRLETGIGEARAAQTGGIEEAGRQSSGEAQGGSKAKVTGRLPSRRPIVVVREQGRTGAGWLSLPHPETMQMGWKSSEQMAVDSVPNWRAGAPSPPTLVMASSHH